MKTILVILTLMLSMVVHSDSTEDIYTYSLNLINGENISLEDFKGEVLLIVNTASECGFTHQYEKKKKKKNPANNFGGQEPGTDEEIAQFCEMNFGVSFPLFSRISVRGDDQHPLFNLLTNLENPDFTGDISWNFEKFLIDRNGNLVRRFKTNVPPEGEEVREAILSTL